MRMEENRVACEMFKWRTWLGEIAIAAQLPGYNGWSETDSNGNPIENAYIKTNWMARQSYQITIPEGNFYEGALIRRGLQASDCFYNESNDIYWRLEYNGWKEYSRLKKRRADDVMGKFGIILPTMTTRLSALDSHLCSARIEDNARRILWRID